MDEDTEKAKRIERFRRQLGACNVLIDCMNHVLDRYEGKLNLKGNEAEQDLQLLVCAMFGKAGKNFSRGNRTLLPRFWRRLAHSPQEQWKPYDKLIVYFG